MPDVLPRVAEDALALQLENGWIPVPAPGDRSRLDRAHVANASDGRRARHAGSSATRARVSSASRCLVALRAPSRDVQDGPETARVVLDADVVVLAARVEEAAGRLSVEVVQGRDPDAA